MKNIRSYLTGFLLLLILYQGRVNAQVKDESILQKNSRNRDLKAIEDAVDGWWRTSMLNHDDRIGWWREARFGMFVHWGVYSAAAGEWKGEPFKGYAEHLMRIKKIPRAEYIELAHQFNPVDFNADDWISAAKNAGMKYFIITAKHHDGFAMFDSKASDYNIIRQTTFGRDPMAELARACRKYGIKFGFYYSHAFDWEDPDAPGNDWDYNNPGGDLNLFGGLNWYTLHPELLPKVINYVNNKAIPQIKELILNYHPDILWFDTPQKLPLSENIRILKIIRETDPNVIINGRLARNDSLLFGDYRNTADRPAEFFPVEGDWEAIPTTNESYGYHKYDTAHKSVSHFIRLIANAASRGGNILLNIGPMGNGKFDPKDQGILEGIGKWMRKNGESIYGSVASPLPLQDWGVTTMKDGKIFLHVFNWPEDRILVIGGMKNEIKSARILSDPSGKRLSFKRIGTLDLSITLPETAPDTVNTVIVIEPAGKIETDPARLIGKNVPVIRLLAFDSELRGGGFRFGDGKAKRYYAEGWSQTSQSVNWKIRLDNPLSYKLSVLYAGSQDSGGSFNINIDNKTVRNGIVSSDQKPNVVYTLNFGTIKLQPGVHEISLRATIIQKSELMKILEVQLIPNDYYLN